MGATKGNPLASWVGLLKDGVDRCEQVVPGLPPRWADRVREEIDSGDLDDLLSAAEKISTKLGFPDGGEWRRWLRETVGQLQAKDRTVLEAFRDLGAPIATTNYDDLIEEVISRPAVTWRAGAEVERVLRQDDPGVLHLHGDWKEPESVILGIRSYEQVLGNAHAQIIQKALCTMNTLVFVGCGDGLADPNFGALLRWSRTIFDSSEYRHFRLCLEKEVPAIQAKHPSEERIFALSYGDDHGELAGFLRSLSKSKATSSPPPPPKPSSPARLPPLRHCVGRDEEVEALVAAICRKPPTPTPILGPPGGGKTTITLAALHDSRVARQFGSRRYFVRCDGVSNREDLVGEMLRTLGIEAPGGQPEVALFTELESAPAVLALDNAETPWDSDTVAVEELMAQIATVPGLALVASIRGEQRPLGPAWREALHGGPLALLDAREAFLAVSGERFRNDLALDLLLEAVDRLPLAIVLLAYQAEGGMSDLALLRKQWHETRTGLLQRAGGQERTTNIEVSLKLSVDSPRMNDPAYRLLSILGLLPVGIALADLDSVMPGEGEQAAATLRKVGLAFDQGDRLRTLAPIREYARQALEASPQDIERVVAYYLERARLGDLVGRSGGADTVRRLKLELGNLEAILLEGLRFSSLDSVVDSATALANFFRSTGFGGSSILQQIGEVARTDGIPLLEARCRRSLGDIALWRSDYTAAGQLYDQALSLFRSARNIDGEANCIKGLGDAALWRSDYVSAGHFYKQALPLFRNVRNIDGEANCIKSLGDIALWRSDYAAARQLYDQALPLLRSVEDVRGEASCIWGLGDMALRHSDHAAALQLYDQALPLYRNVGDVTGEANCIKRLGDIARLRSDPPAARQFYEQALLLYRNAGSVLGEANCIKSLGDIARLRSDPLAARQLYEQSLRLFRNIGSALGEANCMERLGDIAFEESREDIAKSAFREALVLYQKISNSHQIGGAHLRLARLAKPGSTERRQHVQAARQAWESIDRADLIEDILKKEFGDELSEEPKSEKPLPSSLRRKQRKHRQS